MTVFLRFLLLALYIVILGRVLWSWVDPTYRGPIGRFLFETTEPILAPIRSILPRTGMFDLSPMVALFAIFFLQSLIAGAISG